MEKIIEYIEGAKGAFVALAGVLLAIIKWYDRISNFTLRNFKRFMGTSPEQTQFFKTLMAKKNDAFNVICKDIYHAVEGSIVVDVAKVKNGMKAFSPDSELNQIIIGTSGHPALEYYVGKDGEHSLDPSFYKYAAESMAYEGSVLNISEIKTEEYSDLISSIGGACIRIYWISTSSDYSYFLYIMSKNCNPVSSREKRFIKSKIKSLKNDYFSKKNFIS
ncbi:MAG: hypothetical protein Unbinned4388contig1000_24 [Prokaryotic dsDNA virus sp.]|nr:MAG: hypothetical protein Unbinned4388contig1000_24 [Prokaryotic dsDNA virus sp.]|tara:strand:+ start:49861 stop:50517 length:657 start_codon:yes stop_codon:yes gene_type:complete